MPSLSGFGSPLASSPWSKDHGPFYSPVQQQQAYEVCAPAWLSTNRCAVFQSAQQLEERPSRQSRDQRPARWPIFEVLTRRGLPPVEFCFGTKPSHAAKSRPRRKQIRSGAEVSIANAVIGPTPGMAWARRAASPACHVDITANDILLMGEAMQSNQSTRLFKPISPLVAR